MRSGIKKEKYWRRGQGRKKEKKNRDGVSKEEGVREDKKKKKKNRDGVNQGRGEEGGGG